MEVAIGAILPEALVDGDALVLPPVVCPTVALGIPPVTLDGVLVAAAVAVAAVVAAAVAAAVAARGLLPSGVGSGFLAALSCVGEQASGIAAAVVATASRTRVTFLRCMIYCMDGRIPESNHVRW